MFDGSESRSLNKFVLTEEDEGLKQKTNAFCA